MKRDSVPHWLCGGFFPYQVEHDKRMSKQPKSKAILEIEYDGKFYYNKLRY